MDNSLFDKCISVYIVVKKRLTIIILDNGQELSPFPRNELEHVIDQYSYARDFVWCQEEPENAGAYTFMAPRIAQLIPRNEKVNIYQVQF